MPPFWALHGATTSVVRRQPRTPGAVWSGAKTTFGESRQQPAANDNGESFTTHITDTDTGLVYMQARYYDPAIGRFLSNDPVGFAEGGPGYFNRYAYTMNDPVNMTDPTGMCPRCVALVARIGIRTVRYGGNVGRATRETWGEIRQDAGTLVARDSSAAARSAALFNLVSPLTTGDINAIGNWVMNESADDANRPTGDDVVIDGKIGSQLGDRGWTEEEVRDLTNTTPSGSSSDNTRGRNDPATVYGDRGRHVVVNDKTGEVIQVNDTTDPNWQVDSRINWYD